MGASIIRGRRLFKRRIHYANGTDGNELLFEDGNYESCSYSTLQRLVEFCAEHGVPEGDWPIFYGLWEGDVDLDEVTARCARLRQHFAQMGSIECKGIWMFAHVRDWLARGEVFAVFE